MTNLTGYEALSHPFRYVLDLYPDNPPDLADLIGKPYTVHVPMPDGTPRPFNGIVFRAEQGPVTMRSARYLLELRPWFLRLDQDRTCAVFQDMSVPDIVTKVCTDAGFGNIRKVLAASYPAKEYTIQYGETSFAFLSRIMAEAGIFYFFEHDVSSHTLVMADSTDAFAACAQGETLEWLANSQCMGDSAVCVGPPDSIIRGSSSVLIGNRPAARMGDTTAHGGVIVAGCPTVDIGG